MTSVASWWAALALAGLIAAGAWRLGSLRGDGAVAACMVGATALLAHWSWGCTLIVWFVLASVLSRVGRRRKLQRTAGIVAKSDQRDMAQVLANGGAFALCALFTIALRRFDLDPRAMLIAQHQLAVVAAGALAAAGADTWATEIGTWIGGTPWSLRTWTRATPGTSGAITVSGTVASAAGALLLAIVAASFSMVPSAAIASVAVGGLSGATADTLLGAWMQERRWCSHCAMDTEQTVHTCGATTVYRAGIRRLGNDTVNALCSLVGGGAALGWWVAST
jgi:uncharacterized protein (TIGR00297 family)